MSSTPALTLEEIKSLTAQQDWEQLVAGTEELIHLPGDPTGLFFRTQALLKLKRAKEALVSIDNGLERNPRNSWGHLLRFETLVMLGRGLDGLDTFYTHLMSAQDDAELIKAYFVDQASRMGRFDLAAEVNESRSVIGGVRKAARHAVAIQCFVKADTLAQVFEHLMQCRKADQFGLVILQDSSVGSKHADRYGPAGEEVRQLISAWMPRLLSHFDSVELVLNERNLGTAPSCRRLLDRVADRFDGFLFIEDDCLLAPDALEWTQHHLKHSIGPIKYWFAACESVFFDGRHRRVQPDFIPRLKEYAQREEVRAAFIALDFVPSTCFITSAQIWKMCSGVRSFTRGPESLSRYLAGAHQKTLSPVVPRARDIGMLHELGYSVNTKGQGNVAEVKNSYLQSEASWDTSHVRLFKDDEGRLYRASVEFEAQALDELTGTQPLALAA